MYFDVAKVARGAQQVFNRAPSPATFYTLTRAVLASISEMEREFDELPDDVKKVHENWMASAVKYKARVLGEQLQAKKIVDFIASGDLNWQEGTKLGSAYASALQKFFQFGDSAKWANLANQLADLKERFVKETGMFPRWTRPVFFFAVWNPLLMLPAATTAIAMEIASEPVSNLLKETKEAAGDTFEEVTDFLEDALTGFAVALGLGLAAIVAWKLSSK